MNPQLLFEIPISKEIKKKIFDEQNNLEYPILCFIKGIYFIQNGDLEKGEHWFDEILSIKTDSLCDLKTKEDDKLYCAYNLRNFKAVVLKYKIHNLFEFKNRESYCKLYQNYKNDISAEKVIYIGKITGGHHGHHNEDIVFWDYPYNKLIPRFVEYDCLSDALKRKNAKFFYTGVVSNKVFDYSESYRIQEEVSIRLFDYLEKCGKLNDSRNEIAKIIKDFRKNCEPLKNIWYSYRNYLYDIPIEFETRSANKKVWTKKQLRKLNKKKPIKSKREIIKEFKRTKYYKLLRTGKLI